ncbi:MAG: DoxX family protein [Actinomycetota bacterium]|nr:DoxX family protein [Actinomycetota bacterium]
MTLSRRLARPLLSSIFVCGGIDALRNPRSKVPSAEKVVTPLSGRLPLPADTKMVVQANAAVQVGAGLLLAAGKAPRLASLALVASLVPTTLAGHRFWEENEPQAKSGQQIHFLKNLSLIGGLLVAAFDTEGSPSLGYRARKRASRVGGAAASVLPS